MLVSTNPIYHVGNDVKGALIGGGNMPAIHLAHAVGGDLMKGFIAAVAFATILAVVSGLTLSGASAISHDLYASVFRHGKSMRRPRCGFRGSPRSCSASSRSFLASCSRRSMSPSWSVWRFAVAASANFPVLLLSMMWKGLTTRGAVIGGLGRPRQCSLLTIVSPGVWEAVFGYPKGSALFPYRVAGPFHHPAVVPLLLAVLGDRRLEDRNE